MPKPKIGLSMLHCLSEPFSKMVKRLETVTTPYVEVVDEGLHTLSRKRVAILNQKAKSQRLEFTVHSPFADLNIASPSKPILKATLKRLKQSMAYTNALNAKLLVLHPGNKTGISMFYPGQEWKQNAQSIRQLHAASEEYGVTVAIENLPEKYGFLMKTPEDFQRFYKETNLPIGIVLDVGHANLEAQVEPFLKKLPEKIAHIHVSDNVGIHDQHLGIGYGAIDWQRFADTLKKINYRQIVVTESVEHVEESLQKLRQLLT
jgi:sugar phosphate isomerase/epimerase